MNLVVPDCLVENYEGYIESLKLPDSNDRHVLAAAIKWQADAIVTNNLKDFPEKELVKSARDWLDDYQTKLTNWG